MSRTPSARHAAVATPRNVKFVATLPEIGTVYSRWECSRFTLGIHVSGPQTTKVRYRAGSVSHVRTVQPGETTWFRYSTHRVQWLEAVAAGENGAVVGSVRVLGYQNSARQRSCDAYDPPRVTIQIYPRGYPPRSSLANLGG